MRVLKIVTILALLSLLLLVAAFYWTQRSLLYFPTHVYLSPAQAHANESFQEISVKTAEGLSLKAWYALATSKAFTIVFFHGNGDSLYGAAQIAEPKLVTGSLLLSIVGTADYQASHPKPGSTVTVEPACTNSSLAVSRPETSSSTATLSEQVWLSKWRANSQQAG